MQTNTHTKEKTKNEQTRYWRHCRLSRGATPASYVLNEAFREALAKLFARFQRAFEAEQILAVLVGPRHATEVGARFLSALVHHSGQGFGLLCTQGKAPFVRDERPDRLPSAGAREVRVPLSRGAGRRAGGGRGRRGRRR